MYRLIISHTALTHLLREWARASDAIQRLPLSGASHPDGSDLLVGAGEGVLEVCSSGGGILSPPNGGEGELPAARLFLGTGTQEGKAAGLVRRNGRTSPLAGIFCVGPGQRWFDLTGAPRTPPVKKDMDDGLYDRTLGVFGAEAFAHLQRQRIGVIGAGGTGSLVAATLARLLGNAGRLVLLDPDALQKPNLVHWATMTGPIRAAIGTNKAEALASVLASFPDAPELRPIVGSITQWEGLPALLGCDLWISCVDDALARFTVSSLAALYLRPLLDIATGIHLGNGPETHTILMSSESPGVWIPDALLAAGPRVQAADIRLVVPGSDAGCLFCLGGAGSLQGRTLHTPVNLSQYDTDASLPEPFWKERAGSLFTLNSEAVARALRLLNGFLLGAVKESVHLQMDDTGDGLGEWRRVAPSPLPLCPVCRLHGLGDAGLGQLRGALADLRIHRFSH